jgi:hypothetical protein
MYSSLRKYHIQVPGNLGGTAATTAGTATSAAGQAAQPANGVTTSGGQMFFSATGRPATVRPIIPSNSTAATPTGGSTGLSGHTPHTSPAQ